MLPRFRFHIEFNVPSSDYPLVSFAVNVHTSLAAAQNDDPPLISVVVVAPANETDVTGLSQSTEYFVVVKVRALILGDIWGRKGVGVKGYLCDSSKS